MERSTALRWSVRCWTLCRFDDAVLGPLLGSIAAIRLHSTPTLVIGRNRWTSEVGWSTIGDMRVGTIPLLAALIGIASCAHATDVPCIGGGCTEERPTRGKREPGTYQSSYRQGVYDLATAPGGSCERACCEMPGGEFGIPGVWNQQSQVCAWEADVLQLTACENWCYKETSRSADSSETDRLDRIDQPEVEQYAGTKNPEDHEDRSNGAIETRENMGSKYLSLEGMVIPVIVGKDPSLVQTLELGFTRGEDPTIIGIYISPKRVHTSGWKYLKCHAVGLSVGDDWSAGGAKGSDGSWLRFEALHDGSILESGSTLEYVSFNVDAATVREWALADDSGGQICFDKFTLSSGQKTRILELLDTPGAASSDI